jgi:hypothetical protein
MTKLSVAEIATPYCATYKQAELLYDQVSTYLRAGERVELDFENVELASSSFFNELFGRIIEEFGHDFVARHLNYLALKPRHRFVLERTDHFTPA